VRENALNPEFSAEQDARRHWMAVLARASTAELETAWRTLAAPCAFQWLRKPETGLAMLRGRAGGSGAKFNLGEASMTRCALRRADDKAAGHTGVAYVLGRNHRHAELAAQFDLLMQDAAWRTAIDEAVITRLAATQDARRNAASRKAAATRVDFFTIVRGENP
jgi:alpha-D-ribose 1-methylphosphonate 5-triphosphate synthase subunit PhnG